MANETMNTNNNQTMKHEQAKASVSGNQSNSEFKGQTGNREQGSQNDQREKSAIGGETRSETGEPGRARSELDQNQKQGEPTSR